MQVPGQRYILLFYHIMFQTQSTILSWATQQLILHSKEQATSAYNLIVQDQPDHTTPKLDGNPSREEEYYTTVEFQPSAFQEVTCGDNHLITLMVSNVSVSVHFICNRKVCATNRLQ